MEQICHVVIFLTRLKSLFHKIPKLTSEAIEVVVKLSFVFLLSFKLPPTENVRFFVQNGFSFIDIFCQWFSFKLFCGYTPPKKVQDWKASQSDIN